MLSLKGRVTSQWEPRGDGALQPRHMFLFYKESNFLLDSLSRFAGDALRNGSRAVVIGMGAHLDILAERLKRDELDLGQMFCRGNYVQIDAAETLSEILLYGMPDERRFREVIETKVLRRHNQDRAAAPPAIVDEMAGLLWLDGKTEAAMRLTKLWQGLAEKHPFSLCCVYPISSSEKMEKPKVVQMRAAAVGA